MTTSTESRHDSVREGAPEQVNASSRRRPASHTPEPSVASRYAVAILAVGAVVALRLAFWSLLHQEIPWIPFAPPIIIAAWYGGIGPGLAATALGAVATNYLLLEPYGTLGVHTASEGTGLIVFLITGTLMSWLVQRMRSARQALESRTVELQTVNEHLLAQSEELHAQAEDLASANEELQAQTEEMEATICELHTAEEALRESELSYRAIFNSVNDAIFLHDLHTGAILDANQKTTEMYGYTAAEIRALDVEALSAGVPPYTQEQAQVWIGNAARGEPQLFEWLAKDRTGSHFWVEVNLKRTTISGEDRLLAVVRDITERKRAEAVIQEANKRKDEFLAMLSHELRNPLAALASAVGVLRSRDTDHAMSERAREVAHRQVWHMKRLVDDLLDVARITQGTVSLQCELLDLRTVIRAAAEIAAPSLSARAHHFTLHLPEPPLPIQGDTARLTQVFANILDNAAKYTPPGGQIALDASVEGATALVRVRDTGQGIPASLLPHVFELFVQGERSSARTEGGLGIGLTMVRRLVEMHHGCVEAHSAGPGKGSEFLVWLPLLTELQIPTHPPADDAAVSGSSRRVLVVDDNTDVAELLAMTLETQGHEVAVAHSGPQALDFAPGYHPDVVLLDIGMPGMDGYEVARCLRADPDFAHTPLIAITGYGQDEDLERAREAGFDYHLIKPVDLHALTEIVADRSAPEDPERRHPGSR